MSFDIDVALRRGHRAIVVQFAGPPGLIALTGRSGAGKTSVLDMVAGLLRPDSGRIAVVGEVLFDASSRINLRPETRGCGYVFQDSRLFPHRSVRDNLLYGWRLARPEARWMNLAEAVDFLGIAALLDRAPATLSGGEAQRVAIGRALLSGPRCLLLDEPLSALDAPRRAEVLAVIRRIRDELRLPMLYVSHDRAEIDRLADLVVEID